MERGPRWITLWAAACLAGVVLPASAQTGPEARGSRNLSVVSHIALEGGSGNVEIEQEPSRPYVYLSKQAGPGGFAVISLENPEDPQVVYAWALDTPVASSASGARDVVYFKLEDRYYLVQSFQFEAGHREAGLGAVVFDVTGLPDASSVEEVARLEVEGGFHNLFAYQHSDGRALLFATGGGAAHVYDLAQLLAGNNALVAQIDTPEQLQAASSGYHDVFVGFEPATLQDRFYGAGAGGYYVYDVTDLAHPTLLTSISSAAVQRGRAVTPTPDGRFLVTAAGYRTAPLRIYDLQPGLDGTIPQVRTAVGAWMADWRNFAERHEVRWPYVFVAALDDGLQVFNMRDPVNPYTVAYYQTGDGPPKTMADPSQYDGAWDLDVRNVDGLIVVSDLSTGCWIFTLEAFDGWDGHGWGLPNMSSVQDWDNGPDGAQ